MNDTYAHTIRFDGETGRALKRIANARGHSISKVVNDLVTNALRPKAKRRAHVDPGMVDASARRR
jgi:predicted transcriptional regulator